MVDELIGLLDRLAFLPHVRAGDGPLRAHLVHGLGGCGKTSVAIEVAYRAVERGIDVWWVEPHDKDRVKTSMQAVARQAEVVKRADIDRIDLPDVLWKGLAERDKPWLLVVDNADDPSPLTIDGKTIAGGTGWVRDPQYGRGLVIVTSRDSTVRTWGSWWTRHRVGILERDEAADALFDYATGRARRDTGFRCPAGTLADAKTLAGRLGDLPLALMLAGKHLDNTRRTSRPGMISTFASYLSALNAAPVDTLDRFSGENSTRQIISQTWELSLSLLERRGQSQARPLLRLLSLLADTPIPYDQILEPAVLAESPLFPGLRPDRLFELLDALADLGLVDIILPVESPDGDPRSPREFPVLQLHPLVRDASRHHPDASGPAYFILATALLERAANMAGSPEEPPNWQNWQGLAPHCLHLLHALPADSASGFPTHAAIAQLAAAAHHAAGYFYARGLYDEAAAEFRAVLDARQRLSVDNNAEILDTRHWIAAVLRESGRLEEAELEYRAVYEARGRLLGYDHLHTLDTYQQLAITLAYASKLPEAKAVYEAVYEARKQILGEDHPDTLDSRHGLAARLYNEGRFEEAEREFKTVYEALCKLPERGIGHPNTLVTRAWIADILAERGQLAEAEAEHRAVYQMRVSLLDDDHPETVWSRGRLAEVLHDLGLLLAEAAMPHLLSTKGSSAMLTQDGTLHEPTHSDRALVAFQEALKLIDPEQRPGFYGVVLHDIADVHKAEGRLDEAVASYEEAVKYKSRANNPSDLAWTRLALGDCLIKRGRLAEARSVLDEAKEGMVTTDVARANRANFAYYLGRGWENLGNQDQEGAYPEALAAYQEALTLLDPDTNPDTYGTVLRDIADVHKAEGRPDEAVASYEEAVKHKSRANNPSDLAWARLALGDYLIDCGRLGEARRVLDETKEGMVTTDIAPAARASLAHYLGRCWENLGDRDQEGAYAAALVAYQEALALLDPDTNPDTYGSVLRDIADVHKAEGRLAEAVASYEEAVKHKSRANVADGLASVLVDLGRVHKRLSQHDRIGSGDEESSQSGLAPEVGGSEE
ncbi:MAG: tetratricopeptide repeat protein [Pseudonocardiaceae bacterium]